MSSGWVKVCREDEIPADEGKQVEVDGIAIGLYRLEDGCYALNDICTHAFAHLTTGWVEDDTVECPLHHARFEIRTGKALDGIAPEDVEAYAVKVEDGDVYVQLGAQEDGAASGEGTDSQLADSLLDLLRSGAGADGWKPILAEEAEFEVLGGHLQGRDAVAERLGANETAHLEWSRLERPGCILIGKPRGGTNDRGIALMFAFSEEGVTRVSQQNLAMPPRPATPMAMDAAMRERIDNALATKRPMSLSYVDAEGRPHLSLRGSILSLGEDQLGLWARSADTGLAAAVSANANVALLYRDEETRATYQIRGRAHIAEDEATRALIYNAMPKVERDHDFAMLGSAVVIELDLVEGWAGIGPNGPINPVRMVRGQA